MRNTRRLWRSLEATPFVRGVRAQWVEYVGEDLPLLEPYLKPDGRYAESYPCPRPGGDGCPRGVVVRAPDDVVAFCRDREGSCAELRLTQEDLVSLRLDNAGLATHLGKLLGMRGSGPTVEGDLPGTYRLGVYRPLAGLEFAAYLAFRQDREAFSEIAERLLLREGRAFLLLGPTADLLAAPATERLRRAGAMVFGLDDLLVADDDAGALVLVRPAEEVLRPFRDAVVQEARRALAKPGMVLFETPPDAEWSRLRIRFRDGETVAVDLPGASGLFTYHEMGMSDGRSKKPTLQWRLLETLARANGELTWSNGEAKRRLKKRCEDLRKDLRAFFRIPDDPIEYVERMKGWRTRFTVSL